MIHRLNEKEKEILNILVADETASVGDLAERLGTSTVTVRSHLNLLADKGFIVRTWGGAAPAFHPEMLERRRVHGDQKTAIAKQAAAAVHDGMTVMIEAGTTTALIARFLLGRQNVHIVSNNCLVVPYARANPGLRLTLVGGEFRPETESFVGPITTEQLDRFHVDIAFVGTDGFSFKSGCTTHLVEGGEVVKKMVGQARRSVLVADSSKWNRTGFVRVLALDALHTIVTDQGIGADFVETCSTAGIEVVIAG